LLFIYLLVLILFYDGTSSDLPDITLGGFAESNACTAIPLDIALPVLYGASPTKLPSDIPVELPLAVVPTPFVKAFKANPYPVPLLPAGISSAKVQPLT
jgi:hypothetical protein